MNIIYLQLGSNLGDREYFLKQAASNIEVIIGNILEKSNIYETVAWGVDNQPDYLNQIIKAETLLTPAALLNKTLNIEQKLGRRRINKWHERLIDIDIIFYNDCIIQQADLHVPHKYMHQRKFVLEPLNEVADKYIHPIYNKSVKDLLLECDDVHSVEKYAV